MPGSVDDIYAIFAPLDGCRFGQDGDTTFTLLIIRVHGTLFELGALIQGIGLFQKFIDQGGLPMVNVSNNGDVAEVLDHFIYIH